MTSMYTSRVGLFEDAPVVFLVTGVDMVQIEDSREEYKEGQEGEVKNGGGVVLGEEEEEKEKEKYF